MGVLVSLCLSMWFTSLQRLALQVPAIVVGGYEMNLHACQTDVGDLWRRWLLRLTRGSVSRSRRITVLASPNTIRGRHPELVHHAWLQAQNCR